MIAFVESAVSADRRIESATICGTQRGHALCDEELWVLHRIVEQWRAFVFGRAELLLMFPPPVSGDRMEESGLKAEGRMTVLLRYQRQAVQVLYPLGMELVGSVWRVVSGFHSDES